MKKLLLFDSDKDYIKAFADYLGESKVFPYQIMLFSDVDALASYLSINEVTWLVLSEEVLRLNAMLDIIPLEKCIFLLEKNGFASGDISGRCLGGVFKYMSMERVVGELRVLFSLEDEIDDKEEKDFIGVFNPFVSKGRLDFSVALGQYLSEKDRTIYFNLEEFTGLDEYMNVTHKNDLLDLMYEYIQVKKGNSIRPVSAIYRCGGLDYIPPPSFSEDLHNMKTAEWISLIKKQAIRGNYKNVIIEFDTTLNDPIRMLSECKVIYIIVPAIPGDIARMKEMIDYFLRMDMEYILEKIVTVKLPDYEKEALPPEELINGSLGDYIRRELGGCI